MGSRYLQALCGMWGIPRYDCLYAEGLDIERNDAGALLKEAFARGGRAGENLPKTGLTNGTAGFILYLYGKGLDGKKPRTGHSPERTPADCPPLKGIPVQPRGRAAPEPRRDERRRFPALREQSGMALGHASWVVPRSLRPMSDGGFFFVGRKRYKRTAFCPSFYGIRKGRECQHAVDWTERSEGEISGVL